ncbi:MAG: MFS transporter [Alphaproteobacteria bacterium]|nr:MFS transporter [Alphaproteobacteria bacterium]
MSYSPDVVIPRPALYAGMVLALCFLLSMLAAGMNLSFSVFLLPLEKTLSAGRGTVSSIVSVALLIGGLMSPITGTLMERLGPRVLYPAGLALFACAFAAASFAQNIYMLYLTLGVMAGVAISCLGPVTAVVLINRWFYARMGTAMGVIHSASGVGTLIVSPTAALLIANYDWRTAYQVYAIILAVLIPFIFFMPWQKIRAGHPAFRQFHGGKNDPKSEVEADAWTLKRAVRVMPFWGMAAAFFFTGAGVIAIIIHSVSFMIESGVDPVHAAAAFGFIGLLSPIGVIGFGTLGDRIGPRRAVLLSHVLSLTAVLALFLIKYYPSPIAIPLLVFSIGLSMGARGPTVSTMAARIFSGPNFGRIYGTISMAGGVGSALGSWMGGLLQDIFHTSDALLIFSTIMILFSVSPFGLIRALRR